MTSQNDRVVVGNLRVLAFDLYSSKANEGFCVCVGGEGWGWGRCSNTAHSHAITPSNPLKLR